MVLTMLMARNGEKRGDELPKKGWVGGWGAHALSVGLLLVERRVGDTCPSNNPHILWCLPWFPGNPNLRADVFPSFRECLLWRHGCLPSCLGSAWERKQNDDKRASAGGAVNDVVMKVVTTVTE